MSAERLASAPWGGQKTPRAGQGIEPILRRAVKEDVPEIRALTFAAYAKWVGVTPRPPRPVTADYDGAFRDHRFDLLVEGGTLVAFIEPVAAGAGLLIVNVDRKSVVSGKSVSVRVDLGGRRIIKKKKNTKLNKK